MVTALPSIRADLGTDLAGTAWTVNAYTLTFAVLLLAGAALGDRFGRRRMFAFGMTLFTAGSALAALAPSIDVLVAARAVQGVGGAVFAPLAADHAQRGRPTGTAGRGPRARGAVSAGLGAAVGPLLGGGLTGGRRLAVDLLAERAARPGTRRARPPAPAPRAMVLTAGSTCAASR